MNQVTIFSASNAELGLSVDVVKTAQWPHTTRRFEPAVCRFWVVLHDDDAGKTLPLRRSFDLPEQAIAYAKECLQ